MAKQERSERTLEKLVVSAAEQFALRGFVKATLGDVSRAAGVTKGALFFHFATKDDLAAAVQTRGQDILETMIEDMSGTEQSCLQIVVNATHALNRMLREDPFVRAGVRITRERTAGSPTPMDFYPLWLGRLWQVLDEARKNGELAAGIADVSARTLVTAAVSGVEILAWMGASADEGDKWLGHLWELMLPLMVSPDGLRRLRTTAPAGMP
ncbi:ScbR family autoregulator-binding transcription factor [Streptomyces sp. Tu 3180]|uniref:ScbR family autoregulator-binding transcription factor n=1 Tax=Streptomyces sp. Tu 3180 TaxID=2682611 RepID=UPI001357D8E3|nr:ScbR family autoregulator-binding transcription factor [Streptomyces sp. Tu 3180]KAF3468275.1 TetR family transcriptional regulator [Streptomyces sp. Tu 3180]